jgi:very-short-patch-repair endonuclease
VRVGGRELSRAAARAERLELLDVGDLCEIVSRHGGRHGAPLLRAAIQVEGGPVFTQSEAEERFLDLLASGGLPAPEVNVVVRDYELDFFWRAEGFAVEVDGYEFHSSRHRFENDRRRDTELAAAGIQVIRVTWRQIVGKPRSTLVQVAQALARATLSSGRA